MKTTNLFIAQQCDQAGEIALLEACIASGQVSAEQIEAHRAAGEANSCDHSQNQEQRTHTELFSASAVETLTQLGYTYSGGSQWKPPIVVRTSGLTALPAGVSEHFI